LVIFPSEHPEEDKGKFFDFSNINNHPSMKSTIYRCTAHSDRNNSQYVSATKVGQEPKAQCIVGKPRGIK
jgi:hypothetical protein